jgi:hypothetical protein
MDDVTTAKASNKQASNYRLSFVVALAIAGAPLLLSVVQRPWVYSVRVAAAPTFDLPGETSLLLLARVDGLEIYTGTLQTLMTRRAEWPFGQPRDACLIGLAPKDAEAPPPTATWTDRVVRRMFLDRLKPEEVRRIYYERETTGEDQKFDADEAVAIAFLRAMEPYKERVPRGQVRSFRFADSLEYRWRTGIREIIGLAVEPENQAGRASPGKPSTPAVSLAAPIAEAIRVAGQHGLRFLAIPFVGATSVDGVDVDIYNVLLRAAVDAAEHRGSLRAVYVGAYAEGLPRRQTLISALNAAWQPLRLGLEAREGKLVDGGWRLSSLISIVAVLSVFTRRRVRNGEWKIMTKLSLALILLAKGLSDGLLSLVEGMGMAGVPAIVLLVFTAVLAGWYLPVMVSFDPKAILKQELEM